MKKAECEIAVIGGGAAGMLAAIECAGAGKNVILMERNEGYTGKKLRITGKGRCNLTNHAPVNTVIENVLTNPRFLLSAMSRFTPADVMAYFEALGVPLKTERGGRVFPVSDQAEDVVHALRKAMKQRGLRIIYDRACHILTENGVVSGVAAGEHEISCHRVILCTGGISYPLTGSTGDGYEMAKELGHSIIPPRGSLVPLCCAEEDCGEMRGLSLRNVQLTVRDCKKKEIFSDFGEMLFTHFGVSGPLVLSASAHMRDFSKPYSLFIDLKPALDEQKLDQRLLRDFKTFSNKNFINYLPELVNRSMVPVIVKRSGIGPETKLNSLTKAQRLTLLQLLKNYTLTAVGTRPVEEAIVTSGGISVKEVNPNTMESKKVHGLYFAGEVLDVDAYTGGFNLQIAWATAKAAAGAASQQEESI